MTDEKMPTREDLARWRKYIGTLPKHTLIDAYEALLDERDRLGVRAHELRAQLRTAGLAVVKEANSAVKLRARNEKLEAVLVAAEQVALAAAKEGT